MNKETLYFIGVTALSMTGSFGGGMYAGVTKGQTITIAQIKTAESVCASNEGILSMEVFQDSLKTRCKNGVVFTVEN